MRNRQDYTDLASIVSASKQHRSWAGAAVEIMLSRWVVEDKEELRDILSDLEGRFYNNAPDWAQEWPIDISLYAGPDGYWFGLEAASSMDKPHLSGDPQLVDTIDLDSKTQLELRDAWEEACDEFLYHGWIEFGEVQHDGECYSRLVIWEVSK